MALNVILLQKVARNDNFWHWTS